MDLGLEVIFDSEIFRVIIYMCEFLSCLCFPHYLAAKEVLGKTHFHGDRSYVTERDSSNSISTQLLKLTRAVMKLLIKSIHYIDYQPFTSNVAPWVDERLAKRRMLFSWHHPDNNFPLLSALVQVFSVVLDTIVKTTDMTNSSINREMNQRDFMCEVANLLEFTGLFSIVLTSPSYLANMSCLSPLDPRFSSANYCTWRVDHPILFYRHYIEELIHIGGFKSDPDRFLIQSLVTSQNSSFMFLYLSGKCFRGS